MRDTLHEPVPTDIQLHQKSRVLVVTFEDGARFELPCEYLRVFSPSAEVKAARNRGELISDKEKVNIDKITPVGSYAIQLFFDDGHDTGIYSWKTLHDLGVKQEKNWQDYQQKLQASGIMRQEQQRSGPITIRLLYFVNLVQEFGRESEEVQIPESVRDVQGLIQWLGKRGAKWEKALSGGTLKIAVNKKFAEPTTPLEENDEIAIVPTPN